MTGGKLAMAGGIDGPKIHVPDASEEEIRAEVRRAFDTYIPGGPFFPSVPNGECFISRVNDIVLVEIASYGKKYAREHPRGQRSTE